MSDGTMIMRQEPEGELSVQEMTSQVHKIQELMKSLMKDGEHYGVIPGAGTKKVLLKPGAEKLGMMFRLAPEFDVTRRDLPGEHVEYEIVCRLIHIPSGRLVGSGVGLCSTREAKYRYRGGAFACPECGSAAIIKGKAEYGGGWVCFKKKGGCGAKFPDAQFSGTPERVENPDLADTLNTVLKMAKKRAHVDAMLTATAASDIFTQDVDDTAAPPDEAPPPRQEPKRAPIDPAKSQELHDQFYTRLIAITTVEQAFQLSACIREKADQLLPEHKKNLSAVYIDQKRRVTAPEPASPEPDQEPEPALIGASEDSEIIA